MIRFALAAALLLSSVPPLAARDGLPVPRLKPQVVVTAEVVRIGDLIDDAGAAAMIPVFRAPDLGETGAVAVARVAAALAPHRIVEFDTAGLSEVMVTRLSRTITTAELEDQILRAIAGRYGFGDAGHLAIVADRPLQALNVEASATAALTVTRLAVDPRSGRFDISFELPGSAAARRLPLRITGTVSEAIETAVLVRAVGRGDIINAADFVVERRLKTHLPGGAVAADQVAGLAARRALRAGEVLRTIDLIKPEAVKRNQTVTIVYQAPGISLTVRGKALETGAVGDLINVVNVQSNRTVQAVIEGPGRVAIAAVTPAPIVVASMPAAPPRPPLAVAPEPPASPLRQTAPVAPRLSLPAVTLPSRTP